MDLSNPNLINEFLEEEDAKSSVAEKVFHDITIGSIADMVPEDQDPSVLFENNWLALGQSFGLVAGSGIGKSSMVLQMAYHWAIGRTMFSRPKAGMPLSIAILQAEDSVRDIQEQRFGMRRGLIEQEGWTQDDIMRAEANITIPPDFIGKSGDEFMKLVHDYQQAYKKQIIIVNPLQRFFGGDVSSQEDASHFCSQCDAIMKDKLTECIMGIVMHTPKWKSGGKKDENASVDDYGEYMMAGSHEWTDWLRAVLVFQKHANSETQFDFKAAKRGSRLGWIDEYGFPTTKKYFAHSDGYIYWREIKESELDGGSDNVGGVDEICVRGIADAIVEKRIVAQSEIEAFITRGENKIMTKAKFRKVWKQFVTDYQRYGINYKTVPSKFGRGRSTTFWGKAEEVAKISFAEDANED